MKIGNLLYQALAGVHVSIVDVLDCWNTDKVPSCFASAGQLVKYMKRTNKTISRHIAKEDKILKILLREML
jgi:hypothetical protein